ncbi:hypothetical protein COU58_02050 [Candidatus Pacearchaeota archaeon CG10_big_fil_rev_8_21_14_0_10_32_42]|nr:MAG: hypothetical protein COU58_02050 [Candidatus Pacearchaeota archaeon CG10_big_fil_rev_8_21_14_0_10_32_42]
MPECFTIYADEVENRIDPHFYRPAFIQFYKQLEKTKFEFKTLGEITEKVTSGATPLSKGDAYTSKEEGIAFIRSGDINEDKNINFDEVLHIKENIHDKLLKGSKLKKGDVLIAIVGATIGQISIYDYDKEANINQAIALVRLKQEINPEYVKAFMISTLGQKQLDRIKRPVARANINLDEIRGIKIILPSLAIQNKIVALMDNAYKEQKNKEEKTTDFLESINDYIIKELDLNFNKIGKKIFTTESNQIKNRLDPLYYSIDIFYFLDKPKYPFSTIGELSLSIKTGFPAGKNEQDLEGNGIIQIRPTNISNDRRLIFRKNIFIKKEKKEVLKENLVQKGEILFNNTNSQELVGKTAFFDILGDYFCSNHITRINVDTKKVNPVYLTSLFNLYQLNNFFFRVCTNWNNQSGVNNNLLKTVKILLPPLSIQNKIADEVKRRMQKAETLQKEAKEELEKAKREVERIILS